MCTRITADSPNRETPMHLSAFTTFPPQIWVCSTNIFDKSTPVCSTYWCCCSNLEQKLVYSFSLSCQAKLNIYNKRPTRRSLNCLLIFEFHKQVIWLKSNITSDCKVPIIWPQGGLQRLYIAWRFSCSEINSNWLLYWREKPMRILHFWCSYLHTCMMRMSSGQLCSIEWLGYFSGEWKNMLIRLFHRQL